MMQKRITFSGVANLGKTPDDIALEPARGIYVRWADRVLITENGQEIIAANGKPYRMGTNGEWTTEEMV